MPTPTYTAVRDLLNKGLQGSLVVSNDVFENLMLELGSLKPSPADSLGDGVNIYPSDNLPAGSMILVPEIPSSILDPVEVAEKSVRGASPAAKATPPVALGPFADIREVREQADGSYAAYNAAGEYLLDIDREGLGQLGDLNVEIKTIKTYSGMQMDMLKTRNKSKRIPFAVPYGTASLFSDVLTPKK